MMMVVGVVVGKVVEEEVVDDGVKPPQQGIGVREELMGMSKGREKGEFCEGFQLIDVADVMLCFLSYRIHRVVLLFFLFSKSKDFVISSQRRCYIQMSFLGEKIGAVLRIRCRNWFVIKNFNAAS